MNTTAKILAEMFISNRDWDSLPILADAMEDAGLKFGAELRLPELRNRTYAHMTVGQALINALGIQTIVVVDDDDRNPKRKTRLVNTDYEIAMAVRGAVGSRDRRHWYAGHGGDVANAYKYPAVTDAVLIASVFVPEDNAVYVMKLATEIRANKATTRGAAAANGYGNLCDARVSEETREKAQEDLFADLDRHVEEYKKNKKTAEIQTLLDSVNAM